ncbi:hypothetical protein [Streptomyces flavofungini]|uniref:hypothetical protein n=1 Tax=Streptomyces flavofungini TaxID=68200 RepID=UPI0025AF5257|nr:hypothetical protein [Streptomyces flavofungini]WJV44614.1 hypothetical protein QUY26_03150 [Streptomyces flavofungini]
MPARYQDLPGFEHVYLEDSWVLNIEARPGVLTMLLEVHLLPDHPEHQAPPPGKWACYRKATLVFQEVGDLHWTGQGALPTTDPDGTRDFGNVDALIGTALGYQLEGGWGEITIASSAPTLVIHPDASDPNEAP